MGRSPQSFHKCEVVATPVKGVFSTRLVSAHHFGRHWHEGYGIGLVRQGAQVSASGRGQVEALQGDVITSYPGEVHDGRPQGGALRSWQMLHLDLDAFTQAADGEAGVVQQTLPVLRDPLIAGALEDVFALLQRWQQRAGSHRLSHLPLAIEGAIVRTCHLLMERRSLGALPNRGIAPAIRRVHERLSAQFERPPALVDLAREAGLSKFQLLRHFQQAYGMPPHAWLLVRKAERARDLIRRGIPLSEAAAACDFSDQSHMTRVFNRHFGFTPGAWQHAVGAKKLQ